MTQDVASCYAVSEQPSPVAWHSSVGHRTKVCRGLAELHSGVPWVWSGIVVTSLWDCAVCVRGDAEAHL